MSPPPQIKAITVLAGGGAALATVAPPSPRDGYMVVRTTAVALNPTDWKAAEGRFGGAKPTGCRLGCDYAGVVVVEPVGATTEKSFRTGDRVAGFVHGANAGRAEDGAFAEYVAVKADLQIKIPDDVSDEEAATLGVGITTVGQGLYQSLGLPLPTAPATEPIPLLIYGGSTATGLLGIQFARLSGCRVVTTCSPRNFEYVKSLGAEEAFDHADPACADRIREFTGGQLRHAWDCIASAETARVCAAAMSAEGGGKYRSLLYVPDEVVKGVNPGASSGFTFAYTVFGEAFEKFRRFEAVEEDYEFGKMFWELSRELLAAGKVKAARRDVNRGGKGLEGVLVGLKEMKENKVSGMKLVYTL